MSERPSRADQRASRMGSFMRRRKKQSLTAQVDCVVDDDTNLGWMTNDPSDMKNGAGFEKGTAQESDKFVMRNKEVEPIAMSAEEAQSQRIFRNMGRKGIVNSLIKPIKSKKSGLNAPPSVASMRTEDTGDSEELLPTFDTQSSPSQHAGVVSSSMEGMPVSPQGPKSGTKTRAYDFDDLLEPSKPSSAAHNGNGTQPESLEVINDGAFFDFACFDEANLTVSTEEVDDIPLDVQEARFVAFDDSPINEMSGQSHFIPDDDRLETTQPPTPDVDAHAWANEKPFFDFDRLQEAQSSSMHDEVAAEHSGGEGLEPSFFVIPFEDSKASMPRKGAPKLESLPKNAAPSTSFDEANESSSSDEMNGREPNVPEADTDATIDVHRMIEYSRRAEKERLAFMQQPNAAEDPGTYSLIPRGLQARQNTDEMASVLFGGGRSPADAVSFWRERKAAAKSPPYDSYVSQCVAKYRQKIAPEKTPGLSCLSYS